MFAGLKGAVPILLGSLLLAAHIPAAEHVYSIIIVVVAFSVVVQDSLITTVARALRLPMRSIHPSRGRSECGSPKNPKGCCG